jgi:hypothetical protein
VDASVDELLAASPEPSPPPVEVDVPLDTLPPVAEADVDADPIPLVSAPHAPDVPALEDPFNLEQEVSEVRFTTGEREPAAEVTVAAIEAEAEAEPLAAEELSEDDLVEVTEATAAPADASTDIDFDDDEPPASSQRVASSMDEALAAAAAQLDAEREVPLKTPPPESGPQEAPPPAAIAAPAAPDVDALLGQELDIPTHRAHEGPTTEQLGQTIDLEEARGPALELAEQQAAPSPAPLEELEVALPGRDAGGGYSDHLPPPPGALDELEAHRRRQEDDIAPPPESLAQLPSIQPGPPAVDVVQAESAAGPEVMARPIPVGTPNTFQALREPFAPSSFVQLLDASLSLSGE